MGPRDDSLTRRADRRINGRAGTHRIRATVTSKTRLAVRCSPGRSSPGEPPRGSPGGGTTGGSTLVSGGVRVLASIRGSLVLTLRPGTHGERTAVVSGPSGKSPPLLKKACRWPAWALGRLFRKEHSSS